MGFWSLSASRLSAVTLGVFLGVTATPWALAGDPDGMVEPEPVDDVEPSYDHDVEPPLSPDEMDDAQEHTPLDLPDDVDETDDAEEEAESERGPALPRQGRGDRPHMPHIDIDMIHPGAGRVGQGMAQIDLSLVGEDMFLALNFGFVYVRDNWAIAPRLPIRFRVLDKPPHDRAVIRREDWDEPSDWMRLLAYFRYGHVGSPLYIRLGELTGGSLGHGTLVSRYYNNVNMDHYQGGLYVHLDQDLMGGEMVIDNLLGPEMLAARYFIRPMERQRGWSYPLRKLKLGASLGLDLTAPITLQEGDEQRLFTIDFRPNVVQDDTLAFFGFDLEVPAVSKPRFDLVPYLDVNSLEAHGAGVHLGTYVTIRFDPLTTWRSRLELRYAGEGYDPNYVDAFYEIHRYAFETQGPKLRWLRDGRHEPGRGGAYLETELTISGFMRAMIVLSDDRGLDNTDILLRMRFPHLGPLRLNLFLARFGFNDHTDLFERHRTVAAVSGRYNFFDLFFVRFRVMNEWWLRHSVGSEATYETTLGYDLGFGLLLRL